MPFLDVYVGRLGSGDDPLDWGKDYNLGNIPDCLKGTLFPPTNQWAWRLLVEKIKEGKLPGKQVDWGAFAANVSKSDIVAFIDEVCAHCQPLHLYPKLQEQMQELSSAVQALRDDERFALVAREI